MFPPTLTHRLRPRPLPRRNSPSIPPQAAARLRPMSRPRWFAIGRQLAPRPRITLALLSFLLPLGAWALTSYVPWIWHPLIRVGSPGDVAWFKPGLLVDRAVFAEENAKVAAAGGRDLGRGAGQPGLSCPPRTRSRRPFILHFIRLRCCVMNSGFMRALRLASRRSSLVSSSLLSSVSPWGFSVAPILRFPGSPNRSSILCATCRHRRLVRSPSPFSAFTTPPRSRSSWSAPFSSRSLSSPTQSGAMIPRSSRLRKPSEPVRVICFCG